MGIFVALEVAIVGRIGIDDDAGSSPLLRQVDLDPAEVRSIANKNDFPATLMCISSSFLKSSGRP
jgi:hypothetical protein